MKRWMGIVFSFLMAGSVCFAERGMPKEKLTAYLFVYFNNNSPEGEQLRFAVSRDGFNYVPLNDGKRVVDLDAVARWKCIRDPHILRGQDGKSFYMVATDMRCTEGWSSNDGMVLLKSDDLVDWKAMAVDFPTVFPDLYTRDGLTRVWAPQTIYDEQAGKYMVYYSLENEGEYLTIYYSYANADFTALSKPKKLVDLGESIIDADIVKHNGMYHMFLAGIWKCTAPALNGPWSKLDTSRKLQQTDKAAEGPGVFKVNNSDDWMLMYDCFRDGYYQFCRSSDLEDFELVAQTETRGAFTPRHGTVIGITEKELARLLEAFPSKGVSKDDLSGYHFQSTGNPIITHKFTADPATLVDGDTLWLYTGHDAAGGQKGYHMKDWLVFSTKDMKNWTEHPVPLKVSDFAWDKTGAAYAAQVVQRNGKYYFFISTNGSGIGVAVSDKPEGPFKDAIGKPLITNDDCFGADHFWRCIDPTVLVDDDGQAWIFWGNGVCYYAKLKENMIELDGNVKKVDLRTNGFKFTEAPWIHKANGKYYLTYVTGFPEKTVYAMADHIDGPYETQGLLSELAGNSNTIHPAIAQFKGQWYFFYHTGGLQNGGGSYSRSVCVDRLEYNPDGTMKKVVQTSEGVTTKE